MVAGSVKVVRTSQSLIFDEQLTEPEDYFESSRLEGVWWLPSRNANLALVVSNTGDAQLSANIAIYGPKREQIGKETILLTAHETRLIDAKELIEGERKTVPEIGGITINHTGAAGSVFAAALTEESSVGFSSIMELRDPKAPKSSRLDGAGLRIGRVAGEPLNQVAVARNVGDVDSVVSGRIIYTTRDGDGVIPIREVKLKPGETSNIELAKAIRKSGVNETLAAGLEFEYTGVSGSVVISAMSVSESGNQVFRVPLVDAAGKSEPTNSGKYHLTIDRDSSSLVYLKNVTNEPQVFTMFIEYSGGSYVPGLKKVEAGRTLVYDLKQLRDDEVPDEDGNKLPLNVRKGYLSWSAHSTKNLTTGQMELPENHVMIGRFEQADTALGISSTSSYGCGCQPSWVDSWLEWKFPNGSWTNTGSLTLYKGQAVSFRARQMDQDCGGYNTYTQTAANFGSADEAMVSIDYNGSATGGGLGGDVRVVAGWTAAIWTPLYECCEYQSWDVLPETTVHVKAPASLALSIGSLRTHTGGAITDCAGTTLVSTAYGYSRLLTYTLKDQDGDTFAHSGYEATEQVYAVSCNPTTACHDFSKTVPVASNGTFCDVQAFYTNTSPPPQQGEYNKLKQLLNVTTPGYGYALRVNCINQQYNDVTITDSTSNPDASCQ